MAVHLTRIYTRTGDDGTTGLSDFSRVSKNDARLAAYADCDETNAAIGVAIALGNPGEQILNVLRQIQNDLFDAGADLSTPVVENPEHPPLRITQSYIDRLESWCDEFNEPLPALNSFVLPGGTPLSALSACGSHGGAPRGTFGVARRRRTSRLGQRAAGQVPQPAVRPAVHPVAGGQPRWRRVVATRRMSACAKTERPGPATD